MENERYHGFREKNYQMVLKYDGERTKNIYTVLLIQLLDWNKTRHRDTEMYSEILHQFVQETGVDIDVETVNNFINTFEKLTKLLQEKHGIEIVFNFGLSNTDGFMYKVYLENEGKSKELSNESFENIIQFLELNDVWN